MTTRSILAVFAGIICGSLMIYLIHGILLSIYPIDLDALIEAKKTDASFRAYLLDQPLSVHLTDVATNGIAMLVGLVVGRLIDRHNMMTLVVITAILFLGNILSLLAVPHPTWFPFADILFTLAVAVGYIFTRKNA